MKLRKLMLSLFVISTSSVFSQTYSDITYDAGTNLLIQAGSDVCATNIYINGTFNGGGTICTSALPVLLSSFTSQTEKNNVNLYWRTESEINNSGFRIERMNSDENQWKEIWFVSGNGTVNEPKDYSYEDKKLNTGNYRYRLKQLDFNGNFEYFTLESEIKIGPPRVFNISQNYPNPSNPTSRIDYELPADSKVKITLYDMLGKTVKVLIDTEQTAGYHSVVFNGSDIASGVYFYRISSGLFSAVKTLVLVK